MPKPVLLAIIALPVCLLAVAAPAAPAALHCDIPPNPAGFVALQDKPSARARLVAQMMPGDEIELLKGISGKWVEVLYWHGQDRKSPTRAGDTRHGWVQARYIGACG